jgi:stage V sporulation protein AA
MEIYVKPVKTIDFYGRSIIRVKDVAEVYAPRDIARRARKAAIANISGSTRKVWLVSIMDIIAAIDKELPDNTIVNVGETDTIVNLNPPPAKDNSLWTWAKVAFVTLLLFAGSATAIMSFQTDAQIPEIFDNYRKILSVDKGDEELIEVPYAVGLAAGIMIFFNHFLKRKITDDPTPIEVEMTLYESDAADTVIDVLSKNRFNQNSGKGGEDG